MGTFINKTNTDHLLRKLVKGNFANNMYGIYSNQCFDNLDNQSIAIVKPVDFISATICSDGTTTKNELENIC